MPKMLRAGLIVSVLAGLLTPAPRAFSAVGPADTDAEYAVCGRVFSDPHAYWPSSTQAPGMSPFAKGNAACKSTNFLTYGEVVSGSTYLEGLFPDFVEFYKLEEDFGGNDGPCAESNNPQDYCSAGLPQLGVSDTRERSELYMIRVTDERVPDAGKRFFVFPLSIHAIERAGAEAGIRAAEDLATWAYCEAVVGGYASNGTTNCAQEGAIPHPLLETQPVGPENLPAGEALRRSVIYFPFLNPDGWRRGEPDNLATFYQRYNGNGVDMNRDWPTIGYTFRPYTPWSEPETRAFGKVLKGLKGTWDGGIDLHGQLIDRAFSFTLLGASERDYAKDQRILQTVQGAWADAEQRLGWSPTIKPNDAPEDDPRLYGVQWGTVWDTIDYTVTGSLGDWIDSPLGLGADGIDNEMSMSHLSNCGTGTCYLSDFEQLHVDGNKSLVYSMVNFTILPEDTAFEARGKIGYVFDPARVTNAGSGTPTPPPDLPTQQDIMNRSLNPTNNFTFEFLIQGPEDGVYNGGVEGRATPVNAQGVSAESLTSLVLERYRPAEPPAPTDNTGCGANNDNWEEVNRYYNQSSIYLQSGQAVHSNFPSPGRWRVCVTGGLATAIAANGGHVDLDIFFSGEKAWEDPGQLAYDVSNMELFESLSQYVAPGQFVPVNVDDVLSGAVDLDTFRSLVVADDALPGFTEPIPTGPAQAGQSHNNPGLGTAPCAYQRGTTDVPPGSNNPPLGCYRSFEFDVDSSFNNQQLVVELTSHNPELNDWDLFVDRQSRFSGGWFEAGHSATGSGNEKVTLLSPPPGHYRALVVNWSAADVTSAQRLDISFSNEYAGPPVPPSDRTTAERDAWGQKLTSFVARGGNLVLTDGAVRNLAYMGLLPRTTISNFSVYAGFVGFTRDGETCTFDDPLAADVKRPGAAEGPQCRHQTYEPVPIGYAIQDASGADFNASPVWGIDQVAWENAGGRTVGITTPDQVTLGELAQGAGQIRVIGALAPMPTERYYHPFGLANYALTYTGFQVLKNTLQWERPAADLAVTKTDSPDPVMAGSELTYTVTVTNRGSQPATSAKVVDTLPAGVTFVSSSASQGSCSGTSTVTCTLGTILAGGSATVSIKVRPNAGGTITNTAVVSAEASDPNTANNTATTSTTVTAAADLAVDKSGPATAQRGQDMTYTMVVTNNGPQAAIGVTLTDNLPKNAGYGTFTTTKGSCTLKPAKRLLTCNLGTLTSGQSATVTIVVKPTAQGTITNTASVKATSPGDPNSANNTDSVTTSVL
ncbi:MAG TPA: M14 family zinc carboxypeptidase [Actinomycetota bacterium]|nr:M14 family zinc carboxypeptidase [Actinomycetota bacterium]